MTSYEPIGNVLHHLLRYASIGLLYRDPDGTVILNGRYANDLQVWGASFLALNKWLQPWPEADGGTGYCLSTLGNTVLDRWDLTLWGTPGHACHPPCLDDTTFTPQDEQRLLHMIFEVTLDDLDDKDTP